ncbi:MAG: hypothetical protein AAB521_02355 [Patescibacteria group bacterium]
MHEKLIPTIEFDKPQDHCAVSGIISFNGRDVSRDTIRSIYKQQNRGQGGSGIATYDSFGGDFRLHKGIGLVSDVFHQDSVQTYSLSGFLSIGHDRYATTGSKDKPEAEKVLCLQPYVVKQNRRSIALAHNGNIPEHYLGPLKDQLLPGTKLQSDTDSEILAWRILQAEGENWKQKIVNGLAGVKGAYSLAIATDEGDLFGIKDPLGIRPLVFAKTFDGAAVVSETHGFEDMKGVHDRRELRNGEMVHITPDGKIEFMQVFPNTKTARCIVEPIYIRHPNSREGEFEVSEIRYRMGQRLAREFPVPEGFVVVGIPDSGLEIANGYSNELRRSNYSSIIIKDRYRDGIRSFIEDKNEDRLAVLKGKFSVSERARGLRVILIDDSLIRGNTTPVVIEKLFQAGVGEVCLGLGSPMFIETCDLGVNIASRSELKALEEWGSEYKVKTAEQIAKEIGASKVYFLSLEGLIDSIDGEPQGYCTNCLTRKHPIRDLVQSEEYIYRALSEILAA